MNPIKSTTVIEKATGKPFTALYDRNRLGNWRMWVDGKFYSDKDFARLYRQRPVEDIDCKSFWDGLVTDDMLAALSREALIALLQFNDPNGEYSDSQSPLFGYEDFESIN